MEPDRRGKDSAARKTGPKQPVKEPDYTHSQKDCIYKACRDRSRSVCGVSSAWNLHKKGMMNSLWPEKEFLFPNRAISPPRSLYLLPSQPISSAHDRESRRRSIRFILVMDHIPPSFLPPFFRIRCSTAAASARLFCSSTMRVSNRTDPGRFTVSRTSWIKRSRRSE